MPKEVKDRLAYDAALKYASGETIEEFINSFREEYEKAKSVLYPELHHVQKISY